MLKKISIIYIIILFLMMNFIILPDLDVKAATTTWTLENWDGDYGTYVEGQQNGVGAYFTWETEELSGTHNEIYATSPFSSPYAYRFKNDGAGGSAEEYLWWNFTESFDFITDINMNFDAIYSQNGDSMLNYIYFYNSTALVLKFQWTLPSFATNGYLKVFDHNNVGRTIYTFYSSFPRQNFWLNVSWYQTNNFNFSLWNESGSGTKTWWNGTGYMGGIGGISYEGNIERVYMQIGDGIGVENSIFTYYFDDFKITTNSSAGGAGQTCQTITQGYMHTKETLYLTEGPTPTAPNFGQYVESQYYSGSQGLNGVITQVELHVSYSQIYAGDSNLSNYILNINSQNIGSCDGYTWTGGDDIWLYWDLSKTLVNNNPRFSFGHTKIIGSGNTRRYWSGIGMHTVQILPPDTNDYAYYHNSSSYHSDGILNGDGFIYNFTSPTSYKQLTFRFTICNVDAPEPPDTNPTNITEPETGDFYIRFRDGSDGGILRWRGLDTSETNMYDFDYIYGLFYSDITPNGLRNEYTTNEKITVTANFTEGSSYTFYVMGEDYTNPDGRRDNEYITYELTTITLTLYKGQTYDVYLYELGWNPITYNWCHSQYQATGTLSLTKVCINKETYNFGETLLLEYNLPLMEDLVEIGYPASGWYVAITNPDTYFLGLFDKNEYITRYQIPLNHFDKQKHQTTFPIQNYNSYGFKTYYNDYEISIVSYNAGFLQPDNLLQGLYFYCTGQSFVANGTITSVSPNPAYFGQEVTISYTSNTTGNLLINYPNGQVYRNIHYTYSAGVQQSKLSFYDEGNYHIILYGKDATGEMVFLDDDSIHIDPLGQNGTQGSASFGIAYLYIPPSCARVIAGNTTLRIYYRSYKNNSVLNVTSPRGEISHFGTAVGNTTANILTIQPHKTKHMHIGTWNVTLDGWNLDGSRALLTSTFNVVNDEDHWIEFTKNIYYPDEAFGLRIKHVRSIAVTLYKNDIAQGQTIFFDRDELNDGIYNVPYSNVIPSIGDWKVDMWSTNYVNRQELLAEWECKVIARTPVQGSVSGDILPTIDQPLGSIVGLIITIMLLLIPFIFAKLLHSKNDPHIVIYMFTGGMGIAISVVLGLFPTWLPLFVIAAGIIGLVFSFLWGKKQASTSGD